MTGEIRTPIDSKSRKALHRPTRLTLLGLGAGVALSGCVGLPDRPGERATGPWVRVPDAVDARSMAQLQAPDARSEGVGTALAPVGPSPNVRVAIYEPNGVPANAVNAAGGAVSDEAALFSLTLAEASVAEAAAAILGDTLGLAYVIDPRVQGRITLSAPQPLSRSSMIGLFETALRANGAALLLEGNTARVLPTTEAFGSSSVDLDGRSAGLGATLVSLQHVSADLVRQLLDGTVGRPGSLRADPARNLIIISGSSGERRAILASVQALDVAGFANRSLALLPLERADASLVAQEVLVALNAKAGSARESLLRIEPLPRINSLLISAASADLLEQARDWVSRLDQSASSAAFLRSYRVNYANVASLVSTLQNLFDLGAGGAGGIAPGLTPQVSGSLPVTSSGSGSSAATGSASAIGPGLRLAADAATNSLLVMADDAGHRLMRSALAEIDRAPSQVFVDATIAEVTLNDRLRFGVQFFFESAGIDGLGRSGRGGFGTGPGFDANGSFPGFNFLLENGADARVALEALSVVTDVKVMSMPTVMVLENQPASLRVGDQVPVVTRQATSIQDPDAPLVNSVEFKDTGVFLSVTPRVASTGLITLEVVQEVSNVSASANTGELTPTISKREVKSTVASPSGQTVVLGGLIDDNRTISRTGVPLLSDIPLIGQLFSVSENRTERTELLVFLTARVVGDAEASTAISQEMISRMQSLAVQSASSDARGDGNPTGAFVAAPTSSGLTLR